MKKVSKMAKKSQKKKKLDASNMSYFHKRGTQKYMYKLTNGVREHCR